MNICHIEVDIVLRDWSATVKRKSLILTIDDVLMSVSTATLEEKYELLRVCNLPNMRTLEIHFTILPDMPEHWLTEEAEPFEDISELFTLIQNFSTLCAQMFRRAKVDIGVYVKVKLFEPRVTHVYRDTHDQWNLSDTIDEQLAEMPSYETIWKASLAEPDDKYAFWGLHLELLHGGHIDTEEYDELLEDAIETLEDEMATLQQKTSLMV